MDARARFAKFITKHAVLFAAAFVGIWVSCSLAMLGVEHDAAGATITDLPHALWWGIVTLLTIGYGDMVPVTLSGKVIAVVLMSAGVALLAFAIGISYAGYTLWRRRQAHARNHLAFLLDASEYTRFKDKVDKFIASYRMIIVVVGLITVWVGCSWAVLLMERNAPNAQIDTFGKALWWGVVTFMTVGYGDLTPVTLAGRSTAVLLMLAGVVAIGIVTAKISAFFLRQILLEGRGAVDRSKVKNHLIICGWKDDMPDLIRHVLVLNPGLKPKDLVLVAHRTAEELATLREEPGLKDVHFILGEHFQQATLIKAAPELARKVLILADTSTGPDGRKPNGTEADARTIMAAIALSNIAKGTVVAAELLDPSLDHYLKLAGVAEIIYSREYSRLLLGNASSGTGLTNVFHDLIDPKSAAHITTRDIPEQLWGTTFADFRQRFEARNRGFLVIGVLENTGNPHQIKEQAFVEAQKTPNVGRLIENLRSAKSMRCNNPVFNPAPDYAIPRGAAAIILSGEQRGEGEGRIDMHTDNVAA